VAKRRLLFYVVRYRLRGAVSALPMRRYHDDYPEDREESDWDWSWGWLRPMIVGIVQAAIIAVALAVLALIGLALLLAIWG